MADQYLTQNQFEDLFYQFTVAAINMSPAADVRISWPTEGAPAFDIDDDVAYLQCSEVDDNYNISKEMRYTGVASPDSLTESFYYVRVMEVHWVFYGPNAYDRASTVRESLYRDSDREILSDSNVYPIPSDASPRRLPENFQGRWWTRYDLVCRFNEQIKKEKEVGFVQSVDVVIEQENGQQTEITIE